MYQRLVRERNKQWRDGVVHAVEDEKDWTFIRRRCCFKLIPAFLRLAARSVGSDSLRNAACLFAAGAVANCRLAEGQQCAEQLLIPLLRLKQPDSQVLQLVEGLASVKRSVKLRLSHASKAGALLQLRASQTPKLVRRSCWGVAKLQRERVARHRHQPRE